MSGARPAATLAHPASARGSNQMRLSDLSWAVALAALLAASFRSGLGSGLLALALQWVIPCAYLLRHRGRLARFEVIALPVLILLLLWWTLATLRPPAATPFRMAFGPAPSRPLERIFYSLHSLFYLLVLARMASVSRRMAAGRPPDARGEPRPILLLRKLTSWLSLAAVAVASASCFADIFGVGSVRRLGPFGAPPRIEMMLILAPFLLTYAYFLVVLLVGAAPDDDDALPSPGFDPLLLIVWAGTVAVYAMMRSPIP